MARLVEMDLDNTHIRPFVHISTDNGMFDCLIDTGATMPVWCGDSTMLIYYYPKAEPTKYIAMIAGYGKGYHMARVWKIPQFIMEDRLNNGQYQISNLYIAVAPKRHFGFLMIASAIMFSDANYSIINHATKNGDVVLRIETYRDIFYGIPKIYRDLKMIEKIKYRGEIGEDDVLIEYSMVLAQK